MKINHFLGILFFFTINLSAQSQNLSKFMYWDGKNLEFAHVEIDINSGQMKKLYYEPTSISGKTPVDLIKSLDDVGMGRWEAINSDLEINFQVDKYWTMSGNFYYKDGTVKEFLPVMEFVNGDEKIIMGSMPILAYIIYQKANNNYELWLKNPDETCKEGKREGHLAFLCEFTSPKGKNLRLMIDQIGNNVTLWRNEVMTEFKKAK